MKNHPEYAIYFFVHQAGGDTMRKYILIALLLIFFVAFAWSIWLVNKPKDRVEAYSLVFTHII
jgi:cytosine/uracil/thiamine/allantoin permease